jgi:GDP-L-fucose synthase
MCWAYNRQYGTQYLAAMPTNLYGPHDNFDLATSHVLPALMRKVVAAKAAGRDFIDVWGTGTPRRELLYSEDLAEALVFLMQLPDAQFAMLINTEQAPLINIGTGEDLTIRELAELVARELGFKGELRFDTSKPDGTPRKLLDVSRIHALGWRAKTTLPEGIRKTYAAAGEQLRA